MADWSGVGVAGGWEVQHEDDDDRGLRAENAELAGRLQRVGQALASMVADLARLRRENSQLRRENTQLRAQIRTGEDVA